MSALAVMYWGRKGGGVVIHYDNQAGYYAYTTDRHILEKIKKLPERLDLLMCIS